jgi:hypothetical protein
MEVINSIVAFFDSSTMLTIVGPLGLLLELVLRKFPSEKPLSIVHLIGDWITVVGQLLVKIGDLFDKILPQNLK